MEGKLFEAACTGDLNVLYDSVREDGAILQKLHSWRRANTPLHLASIYGHADFVREYINLSSISAQQLCQLNQYGYSPLHLASTNGHLEITRILLEFGYKNSAVEDLCLKKDVYEGTALHSAVVTGNLDVIKMLFADCPQAAKEATVHDESVLHIAVKHHQFEALKFLIEKLGSEEETLLNLRDLYGNTVLHLATAGRQLQIVKYLVKLPDLDVNAENSNGLRALDMMFALNSNDLYVEEAIKLAGGCRSSQREIMNIQATDNMPNHNQPNSNHITRESSQDEDNKDVNQISDVRNGVIVMASIIITLTFQVALTPPGGVWQEQDSGTDAAAPSASATRHQHKLGSSIMYDSDRKRYGSLIFFNTSAFLLSIITIIIMILPSKFGLRNAIVGSLSVCSIMFFLVAGYFDILYLTLDKVHQDPYLISVLVELAVLAGVICTHVVIGSWRRRRQQIQYDALKWPRNRETA